MIDNKYDMFNLPDFSELKRSGDILRQVMAAEREVVTDLLIEKWGDSIENPQKLANQIITVLAFRAITDITNDSE